jgi:acyl-CoA synthetase (AMP-forming)/AMP-acid ligase II
MDPFSICELIERFKVNVLSGSPTFLNLIVLSEAYKSYDLSSLQIIGYGAEPMPEFLLNKLNETFPDVQIHQKFGTSETNAIRVINKSNDSLFMKIDDPNIEYKIIDNELWLKSRTQILGYLNSDQESFEEGWFKTGDLVEVDEAGFFRIIGRKKEIINVGGEKVNPGEVENIIMQHDNVVQCSVYGEKNAITGESVFADIQIKLGSNPSTVKREVKRICNKALDKYKCPTRIKIVDEVQINSRFKKLKKI